MLFSHSKIQPIIIHPMKEKRHISIKKEYTYQCIPLLPIRNLHIHRSPPSTGHAFARHISTSMHAQVRRGRDKPRSGGKLCLRNPLLLLLLLGFYCFLSSSVAVVVIVPRLCSSATVVVVVQDGNEWGRHFLWG